MSKNYKEIKLKDPKDGDKNILNKKRKRKNKNTDNKQDDKNEENFNNIIIAYIKTKKII